MSLWDKIKTGDLPGWSPDLTAQPNTGHYYSQTYTSNDIEIAPVPNHEIEELKLKVAALEKKLKQLEAIYQVCIDLGFIDE